MAEKTYLLSESDISRIKDNAIDECIRITEENCWIDADILVGLFKNLKDQMNGKQDDRDQYEQGYRDGISYASSIDMETPMHFTIEQTAWIKKYISINAIRQRADAIEEFKKNLINEFCCYCDQESCEGGMVGSVQECETIRMLRDVADGIAGQMKGEQND